MDIKVTGLNAQILAEALEQARKGRLYILDKMDEVHRRAAPGDQPLRAAHPHHADPGRQDSRRHRTRRQDDPLDRREDRAPRSTSRTTARIAIATAERRGRRRRRMQIIRDLTAEAEIGQDLPRHGLADRRFRRVRRDLPGHRRAAPRLGDRRLPRPRRPRRAEGRPADPRQVHRRRRQQDPPQPQGRPPR